MPDLTTVSDFPPWSIDYSFDVVNPTVRTGIRGQKTQARKGRYEITQVNATRRLYGAMLPFFEAFVRFECDRGTLVFTDKYKDGAGVQSGNVRIMNGSYTVATNSKLHIVSCTLEVFR